MTIPRCADRQSMIVVHSGQTRVGLDQEIRALLDILVVALGSRHQLTRPFAAEALFVCRLRPLLPDCFSTTASEPIEGTTVDSSPVDHRTRKSDPVTPGHDSIAGSLAGPSSKGPARDHQ